MAASRCSSTGTAWERTTTRAPAGSAWPRCGPATAGAPSSSPGSNRKSSSISSKAIPTSRSLPGRVYNDLNKLPYTLPDNKTQSTIKSRSTTGGTDQNFNELRFEDKKDSEEIYFHAEKDFNRVVENNDTLKVGFDKKDKGDQTIEIFNNQTITIGDSQVGRRQPDRRYLE